jgi:hypothetical protein
MATFSRPGVYVQEVPVAQTIQLSDNGSAVGAFVGPAAMGSTALPVLVRSWRNFVDTFGDVNDAYPMTWAVYNFFANGGNQAYIKRVVGSNAAQASVVLTDRSQSALATLLVKANNAGAWGNNFAVQVIDSGAANRFALYVYQSLSGNTVLVEQFADLSMVKTDPRYAISYVNASSSYITLTDQNSASVAPDNRPTADGVPHALTGGLDGSTPTRSNYSSAYTLFDPVKNPLVFNVPNAAYVYNTAGSSADRTLSMQLQADMVDYCASRDNAFAICDVPAGLTVSDAKQYASDLKSTSPFSGNNHGEVAAIYYPWVNIPDTTKAARGATRLQAPGAIAAGQFLATDTSRGVFKAPAGFGNRVALAVSTQTQLSNTDLDTLNTGTEPINAIRQVPGAGIVLMGARTLNNTSSNRYINVRRSMMYLKTELDNRSQFALFENNDSILWSRIRTGINTFLRGYWQQGGLRGTSPQQAFYVICDGTNNSEADIQNGIVNIEVGVALEYPAEFIVIKLGQLTGNATA